MKATNKKSSLREKRSDVTTARLKTTTPEPDKKVQFSGKVEKVTTMNNDGPPSVQPESITRSVTDSPTNKDVTTARHRVVMVPLAPPSDCTTAREKVHRTPGDVVTARQKTMMKKGAEKSQRDTRTARKKGDSNSRRQKTSVRDTRTAVQKGYTKSVRDASKGRSTPTTTRSQRDKQSKRDTKTARQKDTKDTRTARQKDTKGDKKDVPSLQKLATGARTPIVAKTVKSKPKIVKKTKSGGKAAEDAESETDKPPKKKRRCTIS